jgi:hypothetical protein
VKAKTASHRAELRRLINGYQLTQALHVLAVLGILDRLAAGPMSAAQLADAVGAQEGPLYRVLRAVAAFGVLEERPGHVFASTELGDGLRSDADGSLAGWAAFVGRPYHQASWARLIDGVRTGNNPFELEFGTDIWSYRQRHPKETAIFNRAMNSLSGTTSDAIVSAYDFSRYRLVIDVGAGSGDMLIAICRRNPAVRGVLFDQPHVVADSKRYVDEAGMTDRIELVGGSFLEGAPAGGDAYVVKAVLHNWQDDNARRILGNCRTAMATASADLLVIERLVPAPNEGAEIKLMDLNMFVGPNAYERSREEWMRLLDSAGFRMRRIVPFGSLAVIEAERV